MKNKLDLQTEANATAEKLIGETNQKKISTTILADFEATGLIDDDYNDFLSMVGAQKQQYEFLVRQPLKTETARIAAEKDGK